MLIIVKRSFLGVRIIFANRIKKERKALEISKEHFAELCNLHRTYIGASAQSAMCMVNALKAPLFALFQAR
jgi:hypothetical protein